MPAALSGRAGPPGVAAASPARPLAWRPPCRDAEGRASTSPSALLRNDPWDVASPKSLGIWRAFAQPATGVFRSAAPAPALQSLCLRGYVFLPRARALSGAQRWPGRAHMALPWLGFSAWADAPFQCLANGAAAFCAFPPAKLVPAGGQGWVLPPGARDPPVPGTLWHRHPCIALLAPATGLQPGAN